MDRRRPGEIAMNKQPKEIPSPEQLEQELKRVRYQRRYRTVLRSTIYSLITVAAVAVLVATVLLPVLQIYGSSMAPTLSDGQIVVCVKTTDVEPGDVIALYHTNKILLRRVIAGPGDWVNMDEAGNVYVNGNLLEEPYLTEKDRGQTNIEFPAEVPTGAWFILGDYRAAAVDSRNTAVGCITEDQIIGKVFFRVWPMEALGPVT